MTCPFRVSTTNPQTHLWRTPFYRYCSAFRIFDFDSNVNFSPVSSIKLLGVHKLCCLLDCEGASFLKQGYNFGSIVFVHLLNTLEFRLQGHGLLSDFRTSYSGFKLHIRVPRTRNPNPHISWSLLSIRFDEPNRFSGRNINPCPGRSNAWLGKNPKVTRDYQRVCGVKFRVQGSPKWS